MVLQQQQWAISTVLYALLVVCLMHQSSSLFLEISSVEEGNNETLQCSAVVQQHVDAPEILVLVNRTNLVHVI